MSTLDIQEIENGFFTSLDDCVSFERIRRNRQGRMPVSRDGSSHRAARRQEKWRGLGRHVSRYEEG